jgi:hypothetical protein
VFKTLEAEAEYDDKEIARIAVIPTKRDGWAIRSEFFQEFPSAICSMNANYSVTIYYTYVFLPINWRCS